jgi:hypothetical protein
MTRGKIIELQDLWETACRYLSKRKTGYALIRNSRGHLGLTNYEKNRYVFIRNFLEKSRFFRKSLKDSSFRHF